MKRTYISLGVMLALFASFPCNLQAEKIQHHGVLAEVEGTFKDCVSCHDGSMANNASFCTVQCNFKTSHSILKYYPPRGKEALYSPAATIEARGIKLVNGKVTCISCHNLRNQGPFHLVIDNRGSKLCLTCHIKL